MVNKVLAGVVVFFLFASVFMTVFLQQRDVTLSSYADVLGVSVELREMPELGPMQRIGGPPAANSVPSPSPAIASDSMWEVVQNWRTENGLSPYQVSSRLCDIAQQRLGEIKQNWSHDGFQWQRFCPEETCTLSENLARKYSSEENVLKGWLRSPAHAENLYKPYTFSCIVTDGNYIVHIMGDI
jgi:uncharacterized protein YkwD